MNLAALLFDVARRQPAAPAVSDLQARDPVYGKLYEQEYWDEQEIMKNKHEIIKMASQSV